MNRGDTFYFRGHENPFPHLWIVLSDPIQDSEQVVIVSLTTWQAYRDDSCILNVGDHPSIKHKTSVYYEKPRFISLDKLRKAKEIGALDPQQSLDKAVLKSMIDGAILSERIPIKHRQIILEHRDG